MKIPYDDRFSFIYNKSSFRKVSTDGFEFQGIYDAQEKIIYDCEYYAREELKNNTRIQTDYSYTFGKVKKELYENVNSKLSDYNVKYSEELKKYGQSNYETEGDYRKRSSATYVFSRFIEEENLEYLLIPDYKLSSYEPIHPDIDENEMLLDYLENPDKIINKIYKYWIDLDATKESMGYTSLVCEYENELLKKIIKNEDNAYDNLYLNKKIYQSIKDCDAKEITITITYDNESLTFKFEKSSLECNLKNNNTGCSSYKKSYEQVSEYLKKHKEKSGWSKEDFDFKNITNITFNKKVLYECSFDKDILKEEELEMEH